MHDRAGQAGLLALVQEHRVEHDPRDRLEAEGDVGQPERGADLRMPLFEQPDRLDCLQTVATRLLLAGAQGEGQAVDQDVALCQPPLAGQRGDQPLGDPQLPLRGTGLAFLIDAQRHDGGSVLLDDRHHPAEPAVGPLPVLEVDAVDDRPATQALQARLDDRRLGRVQHQRQRAGRREPGSGSPHIDGAVAADVVDTQVDHVRTLADSLAADVDDLLPVAGEHRVAEGPAAVGVGALAHHEHARVLGEGHRGVERRRTRLQDGRTRRDGPPADRFDDLPQVLRGRAAAAPDETNAVLVHEPRQRLSQLDRRQRVLRAATAQHRQPRVGHHRQRHPRVPRQVAQVLPHLGRTRGAVHPDQVDPERLEGGERGADLRAEQHRSGQLDGDLRDHRHGAAGCGHGALRSHHRGLDLQEVLRRLDEHGVDAALDHRRALLLVGVTQQGVRRVTQRGKLGAGPDRADHPARPVGGRPGVCRLAGDPGTRQCRLGDPVGDAVLVEGGPVRPEGIGLDRVAADLEVGVVDGTDDVWTAGVENLVAALVPFEVLLDGQVVGLQHRAHGAVGDNDALTKGVQQAR